MCCVTHHYDHYNWIGQDWTGYTDALNTDTQLYGSLALLVLLADRLAARRMTTMTTRAYSLHPFTFTGRIPCPSAHFSLIVFLGLVLPGFGVVFVESKQHLTLHRAPTREAHEDKEKGTVAMGTARCGRTGRGDWCVLRRHGWCKHR